MSGFKEHSKHIVQNFNKEIGHPHEFKAKAAPSFHESLKKIKEPL
jgi:hypothetical protein